MMSHMVMILENGFKLSKVKLCSNFLNKALISRLKEAWSLRQVLCCAFEPFKMVFWDQDYLIMPLFTILSKY